MERVIEPEWLDELPADAPSAIHSRADLRRINWFMNNVGILARALLGFPKPNRVLDIGCGDGTFALRLASDLGWRDTEIILFDQNLALPQTVRDGFGAIHCPIKLLRQDVLAGLETAGPVDITITNLFLHHFEDDKLRPLFRDIAAHCEVFAACEPRRSSFALFGSRLLILLGCNEVTRHDAVASIRAGFCRPQLSQLWPAANGWSLSEQAAGLFSHRFIARKL